MTAQDVAYSILRHLELKTSTHFKPWDLLTNCKEVDLSAIECEGIKTNGDYKIIFTLKQPSESFFLFLSSPEAGIWKRQDLESSDFQPKVFSGAYIPHFKSELGLFNANMIRKIPFRLLNLI